MYFRVISAYKYRNKMPMIDVLYKYIFSVKYNNSVINELVKNKSVNTLLDLYKTWDKLVPVITKYIREFMGVTTIY